MNRFQERTKEWVRSVISDKTKLAVALLSILGLAVGTCVGYGVLSITQSQGKFVFGLMFLLTMICMLIWTVGKRRVNEKVQRSEIGV